VVAMVSLRDGQQVQVMIAEYTDSPVAERFDEAYYLERFWTPVYQVTGKPEFVFGWIKAYQRQQLLQFIITALYIPYCVDSHSYSAYCSVVVRVTGLEALKPF
jgi:hypothetical protein